MVFISCQSSCCIFHRPVRCCRCVVLQLSNRWMGQVSSKENKIFRFEFDNNIWMLSLQSNNSHKFCFRKVDERISCNRNVPRPEKQQLVLLRDGYILLYLWDCLGCCWLLMFFPGACQHCSFHRGVQLLSLCLGVNREFRWKFCGIISLAFPWRNSVAASPGWHLVEGGCCVLGVFWKVLTRVFHLKMKWGRVDA